jgi:hypothetical protein
MADIVVKGIGQELRDNEESVISLLPVGFSDFSGSAKVHNYFIIKQQEQQQLQDASKTLRSSQVFETRFRGRELLGSLVTLPSHYMGIITRESSHDEYADEDQVEDDTKVIWKAHKHFTKYYYWNREVPPSEEVDFPSRWMRWIDLSSTVRIYLCLLLNNFDSQCCHSTRTGYSKGNRNNQRVNCRDT